jgi:D-sedoheptulose 7-phosphate isomerase
MREPPFPAWYVREHHCTVFRTYNEQFALHIMSPGLSKLVSRRLAEHIEMCRGLAADDVTAATVEAALVIADCYRAGGKVITFGNGGSAALAAHVAAEFVGRYLLDRRPLPSIALVDNSSSVTAIGNDFGYDQSFARQVMAHAVAGDVLIGMTTSGRSANVVAAFRAGRELGCTSVALTGENPADAGAAADLSLAVPSSSTPTVQEGHEIVAHCICELVELSLFAGAV